MATGKLVILVVLLLTLLLSIFVLVVLIYRRLIKRLDLLGQELDRVAAGRLDVPVSTCVRDEIYRLGDSLRHFSLQLLQMERANALNLINNTQACLITCHPDGTIESVNPSALTLFQQTGVELGQPLWQAFPAEAGAVLAVQFRAGQPLHRFGHSECTLACRLGETPRFCTSTCAASSRGAGTGSSSPSRMSPARS